MARNADLHTQICGENKGLSRQFVEASTFRDCGKEYRYKSMRTIHTLTIKSGYGL
jgi:hypothetical protein